METSLINQPFKLPHPVSGFTFFAEDQVLTADQLNQLIHYLDFQERKTRAWLIGTGIVCGLKIKIGEGNVLITPGCGLTSDGDLLCLNEAKTFAHIRPFKDEEAKYEHFEGITKVNELVEQSTGENVTTLTETHLKNHIVVLYLESYVKEPDFCTTENCDNQGQIQHNNLRVLLLPRSKLTNLPRPIPEIALDLSDLHATRPEIQFGKIEQLEDSGGKSGLQSRFTNAIGNTRAAVIDALGEVEKRSDLLSPVIKEVGLGWRSKLVKAPSPTKEVRGLQHIYAFYNDLCQAYREWLDSLFQLTHTCAPTIDSHPKHLFLGETVDTPDHPPQAFRHRFSPASTFAANNSELRRSQLLWQRLKDLTEAFVTRPELDGIKILPSRNPGEALGHRTRPAYYGENYSGVWNVDAYLHGNLRAPLSYHNAPATIFQTSGWETDFYRIEGHLNRPVGEVEKELIDLRRDHNLSFQILAIQIDDDPDLAILRPHRFFDLEWAYYDHRSRLKLQLRDAEAFAGTVSQSINEGDDRIPKDDPNINIGETLTKATGIASKASSARNILPAKMKDISDTIISNFSAPYNLALDDSHVVNKNLSYIAGQIQVSPLDRFVQPEISAGWKLWHDLFKKRRKKVAELSTFEKFVEANHGLEHLGGVPRGGTFVLVYSASENESQRIVKADFALPYFSYFDFNSLEEEEPVEPETPSIIVDYIPPIWTTKYDWTVSNTTITAVKGIAQDLVLPAEDLSILINNTVQENLTALKFVDDFVTRTPGLKDTGIAGTGFGKDPTLGILEAEIDSNRNVINILEETKRHGNAPDHVDEQIAELESRNADLIKRGFEEVGKEATSASSEGRAVGGSHIRFIEKAVTEGSSVSTPTGASAFEDVTKALATDHQGNDFMLGEIGRIHVRNF